MIDHGRVIAQGTSAELKARVGPGMLHLTLASPGEREQATALLAALGLDARSEADCRGLSVPLAGAADAASLIARLTGEGIVIIDFAFGQPSLDHVFFALTGHLAIPASVPSKFHRFPYSAALSSGPSQKRPRNLPAVDTKDRFTYKQLSERPSRASASLRPPRFHDYSYS